METRRLTWATLCVLGFLLAYLSIQFHEAFHGIAAVLLGAKITLVTSYSISTSGLPGDPWKGIAFIAAGTLTTVLYTILGLLWHRSRSAALRKLGFLLVVINALGRVGYEFSLVVTGMRPDEAGIAGMLGISPLSLEIPLTAYCVLAAVYLIVKDRKTGLKHPVWILPLCASIPAWGQVLVLGAVIQIQAKTGGVFFKPLLLGCSPFLVLLNLAQLFFFLYLIHPRSTRRGAIVLAAVVLNVAVAGGAAARLLIYDPCASAPVVLSVTPPSHELDALNQNDHVIAIGFDRAMDEAIPSLSRDITYDRVRGELGVAPVWSSTDTLEVRLSREVVTGEQIRLRIEGLKDAGGIEMCEPIVLSFE